MNTQSKEVDELKDRLLSLNKQNKPQEVFDLVYLFLDPKGYLSKEAEKIFDIGDLKLDNKEKRRLINNFHKLAIVKKHSLTILRKSLSNKDFENQVNLLVKKIDVLPSQWREGLLRQINDYFLNKAEPEDCDIKTIRAIAMVAKTLSNMMSTQLKYESEKWRQ